LADNDDSALEDEGDIPISPPPKPASGAPPPPPKSGPAQEAKPAEPKPAEAPAQKAALPQATAIIHRPEEWSLAIEPNTMKDAWWLSGKLLESRLYQNFGSQEAIYAVIVRGRALGLDATTALAAFHNIRGKLAMHADLIEALVLRSGKAEFFDIVETTHRVATYETKRVGGRRPVTISFTIEDALRAGAVEKHQNGFDGYRGISDSGKPSAWDKTRSTMLRHRCKTQLARAVYPDVVLGLYDPPPKKESNRDR
jgi:hypothetical protein